MPSAEKIKTPITAPVATYKMPQPPPVVVWSHAPGGDKSYAIVTRYGKSAVDLILFPPESRIGVPKSGVRFIGDPQNKISGINGESGVWDFTNESKMLEKLIDASDVNFVQ